jgi:hypothetical protein
VTGARFGELPLRRPLPAGLGTTLALSSTPTKMQDITNIRCQRTIFAQGEARHANPSTASQSFVAAEAAIVAVALKLAEETPITAQGSACSWRRYYPFPQLQISDACRTRLFSEPL